MTLGPGVRSDVLCPPGTSYISVGKKNKTTQQQQQGMAGMKGLRGAAHQRSEPNEICLCVCVCLLLFFWGESLWKAELIKIQGEPHTKDTS